LKYFNCIFGIFLGSGRLAETRLGDFSTGRLCQKAEMYHLAENQKAEMYHLAENQKTEFYTEGRILFFENKLRFGHLIFGLIEL
jgi:hypothetical protein